MNTLRHTVVFSLLTAVLTTAPAVVADAPRQQDPLERWRQQLAAAEAGLAEGHWESAESAVDGVLPEMIGGIQGKGDGPAFLGLGLFLKAAAEAGAGREEDALWHWWMAQNLDPALRDRELPDFGSATSLLDRNRLRQPGEVPEGLPVVEVDRSSTDFVPGSATATRLPAVPREHWEGRVLVEVVVDRVGRVSQPVLLDDGGAPLSHVVRQFAALQGWRFQPATVGRKRYADLVTVDALGVPGLDWYQWLPDRSRIENRLQDPGLDWGPLDHGALLIRALERMDRDPAEAACLYRSASSGVVEHLPAVLRPLARLAGERDGLRNALSMKPVHVGGDVRGPRALYVPEPSHTEVARRARIQGIVILQAIVGTDGRVHRAKVLKGLPMGLDLTAVAAICAWRLEPATYRGTPVPVYANRTLKFTLE